MRKRRCANMELRADRLGGDPMHAGLSRKTRRTTSHRTEADRGPGRPTGLRPVLEGLEDRRLLSLSAMSLRASAYAGVANGPVALARFTDMEPSLAPAYATTIDWGDGGPMVSVSVTDVETNPQAVDTW